jgi:hypothetical protein
MAEPFKFALASPEEAQAKCQAYFDSLARTRWVETWDPQADNGNGGKGAKVWKEVPDDPRIPGMAGLAVALGMDRKSLINWMKRATSDDPNIAAIAHVLTRAKAQIEAAQELALFDKDMHRGAVFSLQVNYRWGEDDEKRPDEAFQRQILPPAADGAGLAIPKWEPEESEE